MIHNKDIPTHKLKNYTKADIMLLYWDGTHDEWLKEYATDLEVHRDEYYLFFVVDRSDATITIDFNDFEIGDQSIFYISPGQIQSNFPLFSKWAGWAIGVESKLISNFHRRILLDNLLQQRSIYVDASQLNTMTTCLQIIEKELTCFEESILNNKVIASLLDAFLGMFTRIYQKQQETSINTTSRPFLITSEFRKLLTENFKTMKSPSQYANALHISTSYLNEAVKKTTGSTVSLWILQEISLEAKRLLYHSSMSVKEISSVLGYEDYAYFSRLFTKLNGESPLSFRKHYHE